MIRELQIWLNRSRVGVLSERDNLWRLSYDPAWRDSKTGFDLSPALPRSAAHIDDGASSRPVQWFFDNLLPEEAARTLLADEAGVESSDAFGLLRFYGLESAGALTLLGSDQAFAEPGSLRLPDEVLSDRIRRLPRQSLNAEAPKRMSLAGAQHKLPVVCAGSQLFEPVGSAPSTHILKPDHVDRETYPHTVANEWFCMRLAGLSGLPVPWVELRRVPEPVYLVARFDRSGAWPAQQRLHALDACQLLSLQRIYKYQAATVETLLRLIGLCRRKAQTRRTLFRWVIFNAVLGNGDAHLKNLSFLLRPESIELAPHYDLLSTAVYAAPGRWGETELSWPIGRAKHAANLRRPDVVDFGAQLGLPPVLSARLLDELLHQMERSADSLLEQVQSQLPPGEARLIRLLCFGVMRDQLRQLRS